MTTDTPTAATILSQRERTALLILVLDIHSLEPAAACMAAIYLDDIDLSEVWRMALQRALDIRSRGIPRPTIDEMVKRSADLALGFAIRSFCRKRLRHGFGWRA